MANVTDVTSVLACSCVPVKWNHSRCATRLLHPPMHATNLQLFSSPDFMIVDIVKDSVKVGEGSWVKVEKAQG